MRTAAAARPPEWSTVRRPLLVLTAAAVLAGCGTLSVSSDVAVVESVSDPAPVVLREERRRPLVDELVDDVVIVSDQGSSAELVSGVVEAPRPSSVVVVGDSLTVSATDEIADEMAAAGLDVVAIDAIEGRRMARGGASLPPGVDAVQTILELDGPPDLWVIALGTNDVGAQLSVESFRDDMSELLASVPDEAPVVWVDLWIRDREEAIVTANREIRSVLRRRRGTAVVVDWFSQGVVPGVITRDGVHLTADGQRLFATSIVDAVDAHFPAR